MYELMLILDTSVSEQERKKLFDKLKIESSTDLGKKILAYKIKKKTEGHYFLATLSFSGKEAAQISDKLKLEGSVLRYLLCRRDL